MSNLIILMKNTLINESGINKLKNTDKVEKIKAIAMVILILLSIVLLSVYGFVACFYLSDSLIKSNQMELLLILGVIGSTMATFFTSLYKSSSYLFQSKDYEMLSSLPIKQSTILSSKILMLILNNYIFSMAFIIIPGIVYFIKVKTSVLYYPFLFILILVVPLIPTIISSILAFIIANISSKSRKNNLVSVILNLSLVAIVVALSFNLQNIMMGIISNSSSIIEVAQKIYLPAYFFVDALKNGNIISLMMFLIISILPTIVFIYLFSNNFNKINSKLGETYKSNNYKFEELKLSSPVKALFNKEVKRYFSSNIYVMNTFIGMIMLIIFTMAILFVGYDKIAQLLEMDMIGDMMLLPTIEITLFCIIMTNTSSVSISLEGKNIWILKSSPIKEIDIFKSKILLNMILNVPISLVCFIALSIKLSFPINTTILVLIGIVLISGFCAISGILINLLYPKLDFTSDVVVVKRSASVIINLIVSILFIGVICAIGYIFKINDINMLIIISNIIALGSIVILYGLLKNKGVKIFRSL